VRRHGDAFGDDPVLRNALDVGGEYMYRMRGEAHMWSPDAVATLQHAVRKGSWETFQEFRARSTAKPPRRRRSAACSASGRPRNAAAPVALDEVEPAAEIVKRFSTGAMSFGSISREAHTTLAGP
jgi:glutamate synthase (NADPH/NADH) large chain